MKKILVLYLLLNLLLPASAQSPYDLKAIPDAVKNKASIIVHQEDISFEVENLEKANLSVHKVFTVMNEEGKPALLFNEYSTKYVLLDDVEIRVYDANGKQTGKYKKKDMSTVATGEGLIEDGYVTYYPISTASYPVTVDIRYEKKFKSTLAIPAYRFIDFGEGIVESSYTAKVPVDIPLRYKGKNTSIEPVITEEGKYKMYKWAVKNLAPIDYEEGAVSYRDRYPQVSIVCDKFTHYGFEGDFSSWKNYGQWINALYNGLDDLPADRQQFFSQLVQGTPDKKEKIKRIYQYLQKNFRYVSIQLGIGGMRPFSADFTDKKKYGDCKALSNYMKAALKAVGIQSHVAIINAEYDEEPVDPDFPADRFNHVILCVPNEKDSIWLECTSSTAEFGELGTFTENRNALLITDGGGVLVATPKSHAETNTQSRITTVMLSDDLSAITETVFTSKGAYHELMNELMGENRDDQKRAIVSIFGSKQPDDFEFLKDPSADDHLSKLNMIIGKLPGFVSGAKLFISPRIYKMWTRNLPKAENRKLDYYFHFPLKETDTTILKLPAGIKPDALPKETELKCDYASYKTHYWINDTENSIYSTTTLILKQHKIPASGYASVKKFFDDVIQDDAQKIVVQKTAGEKKAF